MADSVARLSCVLGAVVAVALSASELVAQGTGAGRGTIRGVVRSDAGVPVSNAEIVDSAGQVRVRSGLTGEFSLSIAPGSRAITVRSLGYRPVDTVMVVRGGDAIRYDPVLVRLTTLDTMVTRALPVDCNAPTLIAGFNCRRLNMKGIFLDRLEIARKKPIFLGDAFWDVPGLVVRGSRNGRHVESKDGKCIQFLVDGRPPVGPHLPEPKDLRAVEVYERYDDVPRPYRNYSWAPPGRPMQAIPCVIINMWTD